ncbi:sulfotransferase 1C2A-like [Dermacentor albipictus]|uniref:sulfotransferase 1C2A-like n=1 Tax=Dermacentor albipictus TaxID=60249 RepID=UPI0031FBEC75
MTSRMKPFCQVIDGVKRCPLITPERLADVMTFVPQKGDVLQLSYPKTGTHWIQFTVQTIIQGGTAVESYDDFTTVTCLLDYIGLQDWERPSTIPLGLYMSHVIPPPDNFNSEAKYIYVARNPWDCCVSFYHMVKALDIFCFKEGTFDDFFECFIEGDFGYGDYFEHLLYGYGLKDMPNVLFLTYEEMKADAGATVMRIARFLGECYAEALEENNLALDKLLEKLTVEHMKGILVLNLAGHKNPAIDARIKERKLMTSEGFDGCPTMMPFVRKGEVGGWRSYFSAEQLRRMEETIVHKTCSSDVMDIWAEIREEARRLSMA